VRDKAIEMHLERLEKDMTSVNKIKKHNLDLADAEKRVSEKEKKRADR
jgi:hypothetical protein